MTYFVFRKHIQGIERQWLYILQSTDRSVKCTLRFLFLIHNSIFPVASYMIPFFIQSQTTTMDTISCIYSTAWLCGFFLYRYVVCNKCVCRKKHVSFKHEVHLYTCTMLVNVCYISGFSGELVRSPVAIDLKKSKNTHST